jgi:hypothetical protein
MLGSAHLQHANILDRISTQCQATVVMIVCLGSLTKCEHKKSYQEKIRDFIANSRKVVKQICSRSKNRKTPAKPLPRLVL